MFVSNEKNSDYSASTCFVQDMDVDNAVSVKSKTDNDKIGDGARNRGGVPDAKPLGSRVDPRGGPPICARADSRRKSRSVRNKESF